MSSNRDVHTEHRCILHGCKYGDADCTVMTRQLAQSYQCETCNEYLYSEHAIPIQRFYSFMFKLGIQSCNLEVDCIRTSAYLMLVKREEDRHIEGIESL